MRSRDHKFWRAFYVGAGNSFRTICSHNVSRTATQAYTVVVCLGVVSTVSWLLLRTSSLYEATHKHMTHTPCHRLHIQTSLVEKDGEVSHMLLSFLFTPVQRLREHIQLVSERLILYGEHARRLHRCVPCTKHYLTEPRPRKAHIF